LGEDYANAEVDITGLIWWHGYDDISQETADEYESNLTFFIRDIRAALELPYLSILIAELGGQGTGVNVSQEELDFRAMQRRVVELPEFNLTTRLVETAKYCVNDDNNDNTHTADDYTHYHGRAYTTSSVGNLMAVYMSELARFTAHEKGGGQQIEAEFENIENVFGLDVMFLFGGSMVALVVFIASMRGGLTRASLDKAWSDTMVAFRDSEKDMVNGDDGVSFEGPTFEMTEGRAEEMLVV
jgi:hypothetical protein